MFLGPMGLIGPMGPISCDGSYRFYGIDHDGSNRFYGIDSDNGPKLVGTASFESDPAMSSERCCWQSSPSPLRPDVLNHDPSVPQSPLSEKRRTREPAPGPLALSRAIHSRSGNATLAPQPQECATHQKQQSTRRLGSRSTMHSWLQRLPSLNTLRRTNKGIITEKVRIGNQV